MTVGRSVVCALAVIALASVTTANAATITFETVDVGECTPGSITEGGITASFSTAVGEFCVFDITDLIADPTADTTPFSGHGAFNLVGGPLAPLEVTFDALLSDVSLAFGFPRAGQSLLLETFLGAAAVDSDTFFGVPNAAGFFSGIASLSDGPFDRIVLTGSFNFGIDNINVAAVPEPTSLFLLGIGGLGLLAKARRRRRRQAR
jgi:hypothetical protein